MLVSFTLQHPQIITFLIFFYWSQIYQFWFGAIFYKHHSDYYISDTEVTKTHNM